MTLCDTGPLVALVDTFDEHHSACAEFLASLPPSPLITTWPCLTEAMHLLYRAGGFKAQNILWSYLANDLVRLAATSTDEWRRIQELMNQYEDLPLDLADASLISAAEQLNERRLFSMDQSLRAVRIHGLQFFEVVP